MSFMFRVVLLTVTDVLLQVDHVSGITYLPVGEARKDVSCTEFRRQLNTFVFQRTAEHRDFFDYCAPCSYLLTN